MKGLINLGNSCYLNSILQIMFNTPGFHDTYQKYVSYPSSEQEPCSSMVLAHKFDKVFNAYLSDCPTDTLYRSLIDFVKQFQCYKHFDDGQHDQHEYLLCLFNIIHDNMNRYSNFNISGTPQHNYDLLEQEAFREWRLNGMCTTNIRLDKDKMDGYDSAIFRLFTGQYCFQTECQEQDCKHVSHRFETFRCCEQPIGNTGKTCVQLHEVFDDLTSIIQLEQDDAYECGKCKCRNKSLRRCTFWRLPPILVISLKRHIYQQVRGRHVYLKDKRHVTIPETLDMKPYTSSLRDTQYELYATGNHHGTPQGGHYYAQIKKNGKWYRVDDDKIIEGKQDNDVYLLFYKLKN
jgi:ubiquitin C-terminal hydrolase